MRKIPNDRWLKLHTIAKLEKGAWYSCDGMIAVVDGKDAGIVGFVGDSICDLSIDLTQQPSPEQIFDIPEYVNPWDYVSMREYANHPKVRDFSPEIDWLWEGTAEELFFAARNITDLMFPDRKLSEEDVDYKDMTALYAEIRKYLHKKNEKSKKKAKGSLNANKGFADLFPYEDE